MKLPLYYYYIKIKDLHLSGAKPIGRLLGLSIVQVVEIRVASCTSAELKLGSRIF